VVVRHVAILCIENVGNVHDLGMIAEVMNTLINACVIVRSVAVREIEEE